MKEVLKRLKEELGTFGEENKRITVSREDLIRLFNAYEKEIGQKKTWFDERW